MGLHKPTFEAVVGIVLHQRVCGSNPPWCVDFAENQYNYNSTKKTTTSIQLYINTIIIVPKKLPHYRSQPSGK